MSAYKFTIGTVADYESIFSIVSKSITESLFAYTRIAEDRLKAVITNILTDGLVIVIKHDAEPVGVFMATTTGFWWNNDKIALQVAWYIEPDHRGKGLSEDVMGMFEMWAKLQGCTAITMMFSGNDLSKLYERKGFSKKETVYMKVF